MMRAWIIFFMLPIVVSCTDGNIHLLEEDIAEALRACSHINNKENRKESGSRQKRFDLNSHNNQISRIDANIKEDVNPYTHTRDSNDLDQMLILNGTEYDYRGYGAGSEGRKFIISTPRSLNRFDNKSNNNYHYTQKQRVKREERLINKGDEHQCLSQCVFANLHMVDSKGIPREAEVWNKIQSSVSSQQSSILISDQIRACFQELQTESEDDGCSYSNKLERCLMLRLSDRKVNETQNNSTRN